MGRQRVRHSWGSDKEAARKPILVETCFEISQVKHIRSIKMYIASVKSSIVFKHKWLRLVLPQRFDSAFHHPKDDAVRVPSPPCGNYLNFKRKKQIPSPICLRGRGWKKIIWFKKKTFSFFLKEATIL